MSDKEQDFIESVESRSRNWSGEEWTPDEALRKLPLYSFEARAELLDGLDYELSKMDTSDLRKYSEATALRQRMDDMHHRLRKAGR